MGIRTDLALEARELTRGEAEEIEGVTAHTQKEGAATITTVEIINEKGQEALGKSVGKYITIETPEIKYSKEAAEDAVRAVAERIGELYDIEEDTLTLVVGLGNRDITPDSLGTEVVSRIMVTHHMKSYAPELFDSSVSSVCAIAPGVMGTTGMETSGVIQSITEDLKPQLIIVIDALAAADYSRIGTTIQLSDAGIQPGAGVGNNRSELSKKSLGIPVIAIGVPTVVDAMSIADCEDRNMEPYIVTPRDIDSIIKTTAKVVSKGINKALQPNMTSEDIEEYIR